VLNQIKDTDLRVYAVWVPCLPSDNEGRVPNATTKLADERVTHYWDSEGKTKKLYQDLMQWDQFAWDVYYVYDRQAEWKDDAPPLPAYWMHQLHGLPADRLLKGDKLAEDIKERLAAK
jgi:hypothetical protein